MPEMLRLPEERRTTHLLDVLVLVLVLVLLGAAPTAPRVLSRWPSSSHRRGELPAKARITHAAPATPPVGAAAVQAAVMRRLAQRAAVASAAATPAVLEAFDDAQFRALLHAALPPGTATLDPTLPAAELLRRFRAEVAVAEVVHAFRSSPFTLQMSVPEAMNATGALNLWQLAVAAAARGNATAAGQNADHAGFGGMNALEEGVFGFPAFTGSRTDPAWAARAWPANASEAEPRPIYSTLNLRKIDGGNDIFGPVGMVFRRSTMGSRTIFAPVDTGCFEYLCNTTWSTPLCEFFADPQDCNSAWTGKECAWHPLTKKCRVDIRLPAANCSQWPAPVVDSFAGTPAHFDHLIVSAARWWNGSTPTTWRENLVGQMARMFRRWPMAVNMSGGGWSDADFQPATSDENFWEAEVLSPKFPADVKMILALFGGPEGLFGTAEGALLRKWCNVQGWALVWALGPAQPGRNLPVNPSNQRLLDPEASGSAGANLSLPVQRARASAAAAWQALSAGKPRDFPTVRGEWQKLRGELDPRYRLAPLYGLSCDDVDCIGIVEGSGDCVCYAHRSLGARERNPGASDKLD